MAKTRISNEAIREIAERQRKAANARAMRAMAASLERGLEQSANGEVSERES